MSTLAEIEEAIAHLPEPQVEELASWLEQRRPRKAVVALVSEPDFLSRSKAIWTFMDWRLSPASLNASLAWSKATMSEITGRPSISR